MTHLAEYHSYRWLRGSSWVVHFFVTCINHTSGRNSGLDTKINLKKYLKNLTPLLAHLKKQNKKVSFDLSRKKPVSHFRKSNLFWDTSQFYETLTRGCFRCLQGVIVECFRYGTSRRMVLLQLFKPHVSFEILQVWRKFFFEFPPTPYKDL